MNDTLRHQVDIRGLKQVLADLADICARTAEEDLAFRGDWIRAADRIYALSQKVHDRL